MKISIGKLILPLGLMVVLVSGCVTYPISKNLQDQARPVTVSQVRQDAGAFQGTMVIWGGRIIKTVNNSNNSAIYVLKLPLDRSGRPQTFANTSGRFIASRKGFLDPEIYKSGTLITVAGTIAGLESQPIQNTRYNYPVLDIKQTHLWSAERQYYYYPGGGWGYYPYYYPGWNWGWYPGWGVGWGWYYGGDWGGDRDGGYHYHDGDRGGGYRGGSDRGGAYHYHNGGGQRGGASQDRGSGHYHH